MKCIECRFFELFCQGGIEARESSKCDNFKPKKTCEDCNMSFRGYCRRYPPVKTINDEDKADCDSWDFPPTVEDTDWCGEFEEKNEYKPSPGSHA